MKNMKFEVHENDEGVFRVKIFAEGGGVLTSQGRWLEDIDTMNAVLGSHRAKVENYPSHELASQAGLKWIHFHNTQAELFKIQNMPPVSEPKISDTFKKV